ncbi:MAG: ABC transporter ATP-binding protein [Eubacteriales bacterium]|nr:ABC transporter ATP-binding protein [Eubacteriales bacterium]
MKPMLSSKHTVVENIRFILSDIKRECRPLLVCLFAEILLGCITPTVMLFLPKMMIEFLTQPTTSQVRIGLIAFLLLLSAIASAILSSTTSAHYVYLGSLNMNYLKKLFYSALGHDYQSIESSSGQTEYQRARRTLVGGAEASVSSLMTTGQALVVGILCFALFSGVLASLNPTVMAVLAALSVAQYAIMKRARTFEQKNRSKLADEEKRLFVVETIMANPSYGKDIRMYAMAGWIQTVWNGILEQYVTINRMVNNRHFAAAAAIAGLVLIRDIAAYLYLIGCVVNSRITVPEFSLYLGAVIGFSAFTGTIMQQINEIKRASLLMDDLRAFLDKAPADSMLTDGIHNHFESIELRDVSFSFEGEGTPFVEHLNLKIRRGDKIAVVGLNGGGKTTLIKLLCGLYCPQKGIILINGESATMLASNVRFAFFSAVFQDGTFFPFSIAENVSLQPKSETDLDRVMDCLHQVGLDQMINVFDKGIHSVLSKDIDADGIVLSGGQRQKLLMARAMYKNAPVWLLDEPASFLDPPSESKLYQLLTTTSKEKTIVFISHRLTSARFCDRIVLLQNGKVAESGSHDELMDKNEIYAHLYRTQTV